MLAFLDDFEGHPDAYIRKEILVESIPGGNDTSSSSVLPKKCWCYFYNAPVTKDHPMLRSAVLYDDYNTHGAHGKPYIFEEDETRLEFLR